MRVVGFSLLSIVITSHNLLAKRAKKSRFHPFGCYKLSVCTDVPRYNRSTKYAGYSVGLLRTAAVAVKDS